MCRWYSSIIFIYRLSQNSSSVWLETNCPGTEKNIGEPHIPFIFLGRSGGQLSKTKHSMVLTGRNEDHERGV